MLRGVPLAVNWGLVEKSIQGLRKDSCIPTPSSGEEH